MVISKIQGFERIMKLTYFSYFGCRFKIEPSVMHEHVKNAYEHLRISRTFKYIQGI